MSPTAIAPHSPSSNFKYPVPDMSRFPFLSMSGTTLSKTPAPGAFHLSPNLISTRLYLNSGTSKNLLMIRLSSSPFPCSSIKPPLPFNIPDTKDSPILTPFFAVILSPAFTFPSISAFLSTDNPPTLILYGVLSSLVLDKKLSSSFLICSSISLITLALDITLVSETSDSDSNVIKQSIKAPAILTPARKFITPFASSSFVLEINSLAMFSIISAVTLSMSTFPP